MASNSFVLGLLAISNEERNTATVEQLRTAALNLMLTGDNQGEVKSLTTTSLEGTSLTWNISKPADVLFAETSEAIRLFNNGIINATTFQFTFL